MTEIIARLDFGLFHREGCGLSRLSVSCKQRRFGFVMKSYLVGYTFFARTEPFTSWFHEVTFGHYSSHQTAA